MRYYLDTEFDEDGRTIELISIALVAEDGREFYAVSNEFDPDKCNDWVKANVLTKLPPKEEYLSRKIIAEMIVDFVQPLDSPQIWAYFADYDWVVFCQLFGRMIDLPKGLPMWCRDLKQEMDRLGVKKLDLEHAGIVQNAEDEHGALSDARWNKELHNYLLRFEDLSVKSR